MKKITLSIPEISCGHCTSSIDETLKDLPGIIAVSSSVEEKTTTVEFEEALTSVGAIIEVIDDIGFAATEIA